MELTKKRLTQYEQDIIRKAYKDGWYAAELYAKLPDAKPNTICQFAKRAGLKGIKRGKPKYTQNVVQHLHAAKTYEAARDTMASHPPVEIVEEPKKLRYILGIIATLGMVLLLASFN